MIAALCIGVATAILLLPICVVPHPSGQAGAGFPIQGVPGNTKSWGPNRFTVDDWLIETGNALILASIAWVLLHFWRRHTRNVVITARLLMPPCVLLGWATLAVQFRD